MLRKTPIPCIASRAKSLFRFETWSFLGVWILGLGVSSATAAPAERSTNDFVFIDNGELRLGVKKSSGAGIAYLALSATGENVINHWDRGRLVQQSYYGAADGSFWNKQPWRWNPVQGGGWRHEPAQVLELKPEKSSLYAKTMAKHWATGADMPDVIFEQWIVLTGMVAHVKFRMTYSGTNTHPNIHHELPAVFVEPQYETLLVYQGPNAWAGDAVHRSKPGWPNESRKFTEPWAAYVNTNNFGVGAFVPVAEELTCYRFGDGKREHGSCSYFAPLKRFAITPGLKFENHVWLTIGSADDIRARFSSIRSSLK
jgi:hypothetical protein